ncbi:MAG: discoidin domain-containing protein [Candidatus Aminicenantes bacterium]|nr:discoidin domain-containing protein [Candidatus Aminicenantes bacterium]
MKNSFRSVATADLVVLGLFLVFTLVMTYPLVFQMGHSVPADLGDPLYTIWLLDWEIKQAASGFGSFFDANNFFPHTGTLLYADYVPGLALMTAPFYALTGNMILAYNIVYLFSFILCAWAAYRLVLYLFKNRPAAFISGLTFAFFTYRFAHLSHIELLTFGFLPLFFLSLFKWIDAPSLRHVLGMGLYFVFQTWCCAYYGAYFAPFVAAGMLYLGVKTKVHRRPGFLKDVLRLAAVTVPLLAAFYLPFILVHRKMVFTRAIDEVLRYSAELQYFVSVTRQTIPWKWLFRSQESAEWILYPGIIAVILTILGAALYFLRYRKEVREEKKTPLVVWDGLILLALLAGLQIRRPGGGFTQPNWLILGLIVGILVVARLAITWKKRAVEGIPPPLSSLAVRFFLFIGGAAFLLCLGPEIRLNFKPLLAGPYLFFYEFFPGFQGLRAPGRIAVVMMLAVAVVAAWAFVRITAKIRKPAVRTGLAGFVGLLILADFSAFPIVMAKVPDIPPVYMAICDLPDEAALIELPMPGQNWSAEDWRGALRMYYSTFHGKRIANGYSGYYPPGFKIIRDAMERFPDPRAVKLLRDLRVTHVLVHTNAHRAMDGQAIVKALAGLPEEAELLTEVEGSFLYRLRPVPPKPAPKIGIDIGNRSVWRVTASTNPGGALAAVDGDPKTSWASTQTQTIDEFFEVDLGEDALVGQVELRQGEELPLDYPRSFIIEGRLGEEPWFTLLDVPVGVPEIDAKTIEDFRNYWMRLDFPARTVRSIRLRLTYPHRTLPWSIQEIFIRRPAEE